MGNLRELAKNEQDSPDIRSTSSQSAMPSAYLSVAARSTCCSTPRTPGCRASDQISLPSAQVLKSTPCLRLSALAHQPLGNTQSARMCSGLCSRIAFPSAIRPDRKLFAIAGQCVGFFTLSNERGSIGTANRRTVRFPSMRVESLRLAATTLTGTCFDSSTAKSSTKLPAASVPGVLSGYEVVISTMPGI